MEASNRIRDVRRQQILLDHYPSADREINMIKAGMREAVKQLREHKNYKVMVKLVHRGYRNMTYDSDYKLLLKDLGV